MYGMTEILKKTPDGVKPHRQIDDGEQWLADLIAKAKRHGGIISEVTAVSPSRAHALLARNPENRKVSGAVVSTYARDISAGRWVFNGEPIIISDTGYLNDGQHRLHAVIMADRTIEILIVVGVPRKSRMTTDMGVARTVGHFVGMNGIKDPNNVAAVASILLSVEEGEGLSTGEDAAKRSSRPTKAGVLGYARRNLEDIQKALDEINPKSAQKVGSYSRMAAALILIARKARSWTASKEFICAVVDGDGLAKGSPAFKVRDRLLTEKQNKTLTPYKNLEIIFRGWNLHRTKSAMTRIQTSGQWPEIAK